MQVPEELAQAPELKRRPAEAQKVAAGHFPGVAGSSAMQKAAPPRGDLQFGGVSKRIVPDAMALRHQLAA